MTGDGDTASIPAYARDRPGGARPAETREKAMREARDRILRHYPADRTDAVEPGTFEIALVLGGTVSAGAYTAGFADFFIEALDQWALKRADPQGAKVPRHTVKLKVITGASGGGVTALLMARALKFWFPPARLPQSYAAGLAGRTRAEQAALDQNPLYDLWVNRLDATGLLAPEPHWADRGLPMASLFSGAFLETLVRDVAGWQSKEALEPALAKGRRESYGDVLPLALTLTNLRGVPYQQFIPNSTNQLRFYTQHADFVRLAADVRPGLQVQPLETPDYCGQSLVSEAGGRGVLSWRDAAEFAKATAAFPFGFPPVTLRRPAADYHWRWAVVPGVTAQTGMAAEYHCALEVVPLLPEESLLSSSDAPQGVYEFAAVDGGAMNNQPIELARTYLAGVLGRNPREPNRANRCVILVDPFADRPASGPSEVNSLLGLPLPFISALVANNRFSTADLTVFADPNARSRTMVTPIRKRSEKGQTTTVSGGFAIATAFLDAFGGFLSREYREHDFMLGRANAARFFAEHFTLPRDNPLFDGQADAYDQSQMSAGTKELRIIPLYGSAHYADDPRYFEDRLTWPKEPFDSERLTALFTPKAGELLKRFARSVTSSAAAGKIFGWSASYLYAQSSVKKLSSIVRESMRKHGLPVL
jgi:predicted acylesterase/phospholipase RssA